MTDETAVLATWMGWHQQQALGTPPFWATHDPDLGEVMIVAVARWRPRQHIADAWMLVERGLENGVYVTIRSVTTGVACEIRKHGTRPIGRIAHTAPDAIVDAVLALIEQDPAAAPGAER